MTRNDELTLDDTFSLNKGMLSREAAVKSSDPDKISTGKIVVHVSTNVFTGSNMTTITLLAIIYFLLKLPSRMAKTVTEIGEADKQGRLRDPIQ